MDNKEQKAQDFISNLLSNPVLQRYSPLQKEAHIRLFLEQNAAHLFPALSSPKFFPDYSWPKIQSMLIQELVTHINTSVISFLGRVIYEKTDYSFINFLHSQGGSQEKIKETLYSIVEKIVEKSEGRSAITGPFNALMYSLSDKYIEGIFETRDYIRFELEKVERLKLGKEELKNLIKVSMLLRPSIYLTTSQTQMDRKRSGTVSFHFAERAAQNLHEEYPALLPSIIRSGVYSNVSFLENPKIPATSRITAVISRLAKDYDPNMKVDRGASSPEKSWFNIARRNCKFFGYDVKMIDEFYRIAAENWW
ncbi:MAG: hypothetical protein ACLFQW_02390 [Spirochaetaceae bacterium]